MRVVSLVPSVTETLRAWGRDPIACTRFCEQPDLPTVGGTKNPDVAAIIALAPDLVVVDEEENRRQDHDALVAAGLAVHVLTVRSVADVDAQLPSLAARIGAVHHPVTPDLAVLTTTGSAPGRRALVPIWRRPWMALGPDTYGASLLAVLGIEVVPADGGRYPTFELDAFAAASADAGAPIDVVLVPSEPYEFHDDHLTELAAIAPPVRVDGQDLLWWGTRTAPAAHRLAAALTASGVLQPR